MGPLGIWNCRYTVLTTAGTTTIAQGVGTNTAYPTTYGAVQGNVSCFYGLTQIAAGTGFGATVYDVYAVGSNATALLTNTLLTGTGTAWQLFTPGPAGLGVRVLGSLVSVAAGTPGSINLLWD